MLDNGKVYLRALEPTDIDVIHRWENDCDLWRFGCATAPFSLHQIWEYLKNYTADIFAQKQLRMMVCLKTADNAVGMILHQVYAVVAADNAPSLWMFEKAGFRNAGTLHDWLLRADGGYVDALQMQLIVD